MRLGFLLILFALVLGSCGEKTQEKSREISTEKLTALDLVNEELRANPGSAPLYFKRAQLHLENGAYEMAWNDANRCVALDSLNGSYHVLKGEVLFVQNKFDEAISLFQKGVDLDPNYAPGFARLSQVQLYLRNYEKAMSLANSALRLDQLLHTPYYIKGWIYLETGDTLKAVNSFQTALEVEPDYYDAYIMLGNLYAGAGKEIAVEYFQSAYELDTLNVEPLYLEGVFHQQMGSFEKAIQLYKRCVSLNPAHAFAHYNQGFIWLEHWDNPDSAFVNFAKAAVIEPSYAAAFFNMGLCRELKNESDIALSYYRKALEANPSFEPAILGVNRLMMP